MSEDRIHHLSVERTTRRRDVRVEYQLVFGEFNLAQIKAEVSSSKETITYCDFSSDLKRSLSEILDADYGLIEKLSCVLTERQYESLSQDKGYKRNDKLVEIVNLLPRDNFLKALGETGQQHVVNFIKHEESNRAVDVDETCWPLNEKQRTILRSSRYELAAVIDMDGLLPILYSSNCITRVHYDCIRTKETTFDRNSCFLAILLKRSQADYLGVVKALIKIGQSHLTTILSAGGGVVAIRTLIAESHLEVGIAIKLRQWREGASQEDLLRMNELLGPDLKLVDLRQSCSVAVYIHCRTLSAVQRLNAKLEDGSLKSMAGEIFSTVHDGRHVEMEKIDFYQQSYNTCLHFFYKSMGCYDKFVVCDPHDVMDVMELRNSCPAVRDLPLVLLEKVLMKGVVLYFKYLMKLISTDADSIAVSALSMVCRHWRFVLKNRTFIKEQIKGTLNYGSSSIVRGVAMLDSNLFVVSADSSTVCVFDLTSFTQLRNIELRGLLKDPKDIAACEAIRRIYIADSGNKCVWRLDRSSTSLSISAVDSSPAVKFIDCKGYLPWGLSTIGRHHQLLVTGLPYSLYVYDVDGKLLRCVKLSTELDDDGVKWNDTLHAIQATSCDTYFVCRFGSYQRPLTHAEVAEYDSTGQRLRSYYSGPRGDGPQQVNKPLHISVIGDGRLIVADFYARRVLLLNSELKLERILLTRQQLDVDDDSSSNSPVGLCYNSKTGLLCVGMNRGRVNVYKIC